MPSQDQHPIVSKSRLGFVAALFLVLIVLAHVAASWSAARDAKHAAARDERRLELVRDALARGELPPALPAVEPPHSVVYYRIVFTIWVTLVLLIPAFCFYIMRSPATTSDYWLLFWTASYLAYLLHFYWAVFVLFGGNFGEILNSPLGANANPEKVVCNPIPDFVLTAWWGVDVVLAWVLLYQGILANSRLVQLQRGALQIFTFVAFFGATVIAPKAGLIAHLLGLLMVLIATVFFAMRIVLRQMDRDALLGRAYIQSFVLLNKVWPWYRLPTWLGIMNLGALREVLRVKNLHGTNDIEISNPQGRMPPPSFTSDVLGQRDLDGYFNDLRKPEMGSGSESAAATPVGQITKSNPGARFGRNIPLDRAWPKENLLMKPNPREISRRLLARDHFKPATILNLLAAAWIQFETHDWFFHGEPVNENPFGIDLKPDDPWQKYAPQMRIRRTRPDPTRDYNAEALRAKSEPGYQRQPPTYVNAESHWWDASQIYGSDPASAKRLRSDPATGQLLPDGKLYLDPQDLLGLDPTTGVELSGFTGNWWLGLTLLHTLFTREHNAICDALRTAYPDKSEWPDERVFQTARLVNAALIAKIHTIEWTPAILPNPALQIGMHANWDGLLGAPIKEAWGRISEGEAFSGIPGSTTSHHAADYTLTEEFVSVYRMHPLIPDGLWVCALATGAELANFTMMQIAGPSSRKTVLREGITLADVFYSFGICHPGALVLRNYPDFLRDLERVDGNGNPIERLDLAAVDILRDRERGVPRYNDFRELLHLPRITSFEALNPEYARELADVYENNIDNLDLMVGLFAEAPPPAFGFSDTAFRIFILMASRRLKSDRYFTTDFNPNVYSHVGFDWVNKNGMLTVLRRHFPALAPVLRGVTNAFAPWPTLDESRRYHPHEEDAKLAATSGGN